MKHLILAAAAAAVCTIGHAQTNVAVYGIVDSGVVYAKGGPNGSLTRLEGGISGGSRLGFRGTEDLGGGVSALFTLENGFLTDTGGFDQGGLLFGRQAFVGLKANAGTLTVGRQYVPIYRALTTIDPFENNFGGGAGQLMAGARAGVRMNNSVIYTTPTVGGFSGMFGYSFGEVAGNSSAGRQVSANVGYESGPLVIRAAYNKTNNAAATDAAENTLLIAKYNFGPAIAGLGFGTNKGLTTVDSHDMIAALTVPFGPHTVMATHVRKDDRSPVTNLDAHQSSVAYTYALSKRTSLYGAYTKLSNTRFTTTKFGPGDTEFDIGIRHTF